MSFMFQRFDGRTSNWDYFTGLFKLFMFYCFGIQFLSLLLANFLGHTEGMEGFSKALPLAATLTSAIILRPLLALINKRKHDLTEAIRVSLSAFIALLPVAVVAVVTAQMLRVAGIGLGDLVRTILGFIPIVLMGIVVLGFLPSQGGTNRFGPDPRLERGKVKIPAQSQVFPKTRYSAPTATAKTSASVAERTSAMKSPVLRTRKLPSDGRIKPGWLS